MLQHPKLSHKNTTQLPNICSNSMPTIKHESIQYWETYRGQIANSNNHRGERHRYTDETAKDTASYMEVFTNIVKHINGA